MNPIDFTKAMIRLSDHRVGVREAACLMLTQGGAINASIAKAAKERGFVTRCRLNSLKNKGLVEIVDRGEQPKLYRPTLRGQVIINHVLGK
jgi:hypothetical protein